MTFKEFLDRVIDDGIAAARTSYAAVSESDDKLRGSIAGFEACRNQSYLGLQELLAETQRDVQTHMLSQSSEYWYYQCRAMEVDWVCNVVSAVLVNEGAESLAAFLPTARGMFKAAEILGVGQGVAGFQTINSNRGQL